MDRCTEPRHVRWHGQQLQPPERGYRYASRIVEFPGAVAATPEQATAHYADWYICGGPDSGERLQAIKLSITEADGRWPAEVWWVEHIYGTEPDACPSMLETAVTAARSVNFKVTVLLGQEIVDEQVRAAADRGQRIARWARGEDVLER